MGADRGELRVKLPRDGCAFGVRLALKGYGLVGRAIHAFTRQAADKVGELGRVILVL